MFESTNSSLVTASLCLLSLALTVARPDRQPPHVQNQTRQTQRSQEHQPTAYSCCDRSKSNIFSRDVHPFLRRLRIKLAISCPGFQKKRSLKNFATSFTSSTILSVSSSPMVPRKMVPAASTVSAPMATAPPLPCRRIVRIDTYEGQLADQGCKFSRSHLQFVFAV